MRHKFLLVVLFSVFLIIFSLIQVSATTYNCYKIEGYYDGFFDFSGSTAERYCSYNPTNPWDGKFYGDDTFTIPEYYPYYNPYYCSWPVPEPPDYLGTAINELDFRTWSPEVNYIRRLDDNSWEIDIQCMHYFSGMDYPIWNGYKREGHTPEGVYTKLFGDDSKYATIEIVPCENAVEVEEICGDGQDNNCNILQDCSEENCNLKFCSDFGSGIPGVCMKKMCVSAKPTAKLTIDSEYLDKLPVDKEEYLKETEIPKSTAGVSYGTYYLVVSPYDKLNCNSTFYGFINTDGLSKEEIEKIKQNELVIEFSLEEFSLNENGLPVLTGRIPIETGFKKCKPIPTDETYNPTLVYNCDYTFEGVGDVNRGKLIGCTTALKPTGEINISAVSNAVVIAKYLYILSDFIDDMSSTELKPFYESYVKLSELNNKLEDSGKDIYTSKSIPSFRNGQMNLICEHLNEIECKKFSNCEWKKGFGFLQKNKCVRTLSLTKWVEDSINKIGIKYNKNMDDKIILQITPQQINLPTENFGGFVEDLGSLVIFINKLTDVSFTLPHEMGHASINSKLCDEYQYGFWKLQNNKFKCPNPFPVCCGGLCRENNGVWLKDCSLYGSEQIGNIEQKVILGGKEETLKCCKSPCNSWDIECLTRISLIGINFGCGLMNNLDFYFPLPFQLIGCKGMPYEDDRVTKDEVWPGKLPVNFGPKNSLMTSFDAPYLIYPKEAKCPLRNCQWKD